jgi:hypothetical protein
METRGYVEAAEAIKNGIFERYPQVVFGVLGTPAVIAVGWPTLEVYNIPDNQISQCDDLVAKLWAAEAQPYGLFFDIITHTRTNTLKYYAEVLTEAQRLEV